jgi:hypothetical protein
MLVCIDGSGAIQQVSFGEEIRWLLFSSDYSRSAVLTPGEILICAGDFRDSHPRITLNTDLVSRVACCRAQSVLTATNTKAIMIGTENGGTLTWDYP